MKSATTGRKLKATGKETTDWDRVRGLSDAEVHASIEGDPDAHATDEQFWAAAKIVMPGRKEVVTIRLDTDLLEWLRRKPGYQTRINAILRAYMRANKDG